MLKNSLYCVKMTKIQKQFLMEVYHMKKLKFAPLALAAMLCLTGCNGNSTPDETTPTTQPPAVISPTDPDGNSSVPPINENMYHVSLPITVESFYADDSTLICNYSYQTISPVLQDRDVSDKIIMDFTDRIEKTRIDADNVRNIAESLYQPGSDFTPLSYEIQYDVTRIDQGVLSLFGHILQTSDAAGSNRSLIAANYDLVTGDMLTIGSILYHIDSKDDLTQLVLDHLSKRDDLNLFDGYEETVKARFARDESTDEDFYFSNNGLCFYFSPYEITPRANGIIIVEIPYNQLTGIIADAFFPVERTYTKGTLSIIPFQDATLDNYEQFPEFVAKPESTKLLLTTDSCVQDIRVQQLVWAENGLYFTQSKNVFACNFLSSENAIILEADFNTEIPMYMVSYSVEGVTQSYYILKDSASGQFILEADYAPGM